MVPNHNNNTSDIILNFLNCIKQLKFNQAKDILRGLGEVDGHYLLQCLFNDCYIESIITCEERLSAKTIDYLIQVLTKCSAEVRDQFFEICTQKYRDIVQREPCAISETSSDSATEISSAEPVASSNLLGKDISATPAPCNLKSVCKKYQGTMAAVVSMMVLALALVLYFKLTEGRIEHPAPEFVNNLNNSTVNNYFTGTTEKESENFINVTVTANTNTTTTKQGGRSTKNLYNEKIMEPGSIDVDIEHLYMICSSRSASRWNLLKITSAEPMQYEDFHIPCAGKFKNITFSGYFNEETLIELVIQFFNAEYIQFVDFKVFQNLNEVIPPLNTSFTKLRSVVLHNVFNLPATVSVLSSINITGLENLTISHCSITEGFDIQFSHFTSKHSLRYLTYDHVHVDLENASKLFRNVTLGELSNFILNVRYPRTDNALAFLNYNLAIIGNNLRSIESNVHVSLSNVRLFLKPKYAKLEHISIHARIRSKTNQARFSLKFMNKFKNKIEWVIFTVLKFKSYSNHENTNYVLKIDDVNMISHNFTVHSHHKIKISNECTESIQEVYELWKDPYFIICKFNKTSINSAEI